MKKIVIPNRASIKKWGNYLAKSVGITLLVILIINIIYAIIELQATSISDDFSIKFKYGSFVINGKHVGLKLSDKEYWLFYLFIFGLSLFYLYKKKKQNTQNEKNERYI